MTGDGTVELEFQLIMPPDRDWSIRTMTENKTSHHHTITRAPDHPTKKSAAQRTGAAARWEAMIRGVCDQAFLPVFQS
jgi:hypothetical protein